MLKNPKKREHDKVFYEKLNLSMSKVKSLVGKFYSLIKNFIKKIPKKYIRVFEILILIFLSVALFVNREKFSPDYVGTFLEDLFAEVQHGNGYPYKISGSKVNNENFKIIDKDLFLLSDTTLSVTNTSAKEMHKSQHCYQNPMLKVSNTRAVVYDLGGKNLEITSRSKTLHTAAMNNNIISAAVSNYETFAAVTEAKGFLGQLSVFAKNGRDVYYKYNFADHYITDVAISENGKSVAVCGSTAKDGSIISTVYVFDYKSEEPKVKLNYDDNMFICVEYLSNGNVVAVGDRLISVINAKNGSKEDYFYDNKNLIGFDINKKEGILLALSLSEDGNNTNMVVINKNGKVDKSFHTEHSVKAVSFNHGKLAALAYGEVYVYNFSGKKINSFNVGNDVKNIRLFSSKDIYVLGITEVRKIRF
ncbi:MAG: DUF5711 family protein [Acutalibacteraceae bacterium]